MTLKLADFPFQMNLDFVRLGQKSKVHAEIQPYIVENLTNDVKTVHEVERFYSTKVSVHICSIIVMCVLCVHFKVAIVTGML